MINISKLYCGLAGESDHLRYKDTSNLGPVIVYNCTQRCNLKCLHCYSTSENNRNDNELTTGQVKDMLAQLVKIKCPVVLFSGGEPLLRNDLLELLAEAGNLGLRTVISTNGTLIDDDTAKKLSDLNISYVGISLDGDKTFHDSFRQSNGCFDTAIKGIQNCNKAGLRTGIRFTITKVNADKIPVIFEIAKSVSVRRLCFYHLIRTGRGAEPAIQATAPKQTRDVVNTIIEKTAQFVDQGLIDEVLTVGNHADGPYLLLKMSTENPKDYEKACGLLAANGGNRTGEKIGCISWDGNVYPDQFWRSYRLGNIKEQPFNKIWNNPDEPVLNQLRNKDKFRAVKCMSCRWFEYCKGNFRFLGTEAADENWLNEPACYLTEEEIKITETTSINI